MFTIICFSLPSRPWQAYFSQEKRQLRPGRPQPPRGPQRRRRLPGRLQPQFPRRAAHGLDWALVGHLVEDTSSAQHLENAFVVGSHGGSQFVWNTPQQTTRQGSWIPVLGEPCFRIEGHAEWHSPSDLR